MADEDTTNETAGAPPTDAPTDAPAPETVAPSPEPATTEPQPEPPAPDDALTEAQQALIAEVRARVANANYGVSAALDITLVDRGDHGLLLFAADEAQEALRAASAALASVPDDDGRAWRFMGGGPDLETGRYRAVVRVSDLAPAQAAGQVEDGATAQAE